MSDLRKIGAFWKKEGKSGTFYGGTMDAEKVKSALAGDETRLLLFKVKNKKERGPDLELFAASNERRESTSRRESRVDDFENDGFGDLP